MAAKNQKPIGQGREMVGGVYRSGQYKGKTTGLTKKQVAAGKRVGSAGKPSVGKKEATRAMKPVKIENTTWRTAAERTGPRAKGGILVGNDGKPVTGTVTLASGKTATYVRGKRVAAATAKSKPKPKPASGGGGKTGGGTGAGAGTGTRPRSVSDFSTPSRTGALGRGASKGSPSGIASRYAPSQPKDGEIRWRKIPGGGAAKVRYNAANKRWETLQVRRG